MGRILASNRLLKLRLVAVGGADLLPSLSQILQGKRSTGIFARMCGSFHASMDGISINVGVIVGANRMKKDRNMFPIEMCVRICTHHEKWLMPKLIFS
jgi:hypothetical protein